MYVYIYIYIYIYIASGKYAQSPQGLGNHVGRFMRAGCTGMSVQVHRLHH